MRILYDSKLSTYKTPFGTLTPGEVCTMNIHIPSTVQATRVQLELLHHDHAPYRPYDFEFAAKKGAYDIFRLQFTIPRRGFTSTTSGSITSTAPSGSTSRGTTPIWRPATCGS